MSPTTPLRARIEATLELIADREAQLRYQADVPYVDVSTELFLQWEDDYRPQDDAFGRAFDPEEALALRAFHEVFVAVRNTFWPELPAIETLVQTTAWKLYGDAARTALHATRSPSMAA
ncbi:hypothetical protein [Paraliomyxa miuraensis]|uniref:hypothetical protein n=1 Tax=Paraliomyxa miuraensis TaxID=376150 RepID=UPI002255C100|nr:hypothetical protein [Paraliomyxa miuraensis]MCX4242788.1 hypothetical protein [Paraliomyxa miuraensis]